MFVPAKDINTKLLILSRLSDLMTCNACCNIQSEGSIYHLGTLGEDKIYRLYVHQILMYTKCEQCYA